MFKKDLFRPSGRVILSLLLVPFLLPQIVLADVDVDAFRYVAKRLQPNECQRIITRAAADSSFSSRSSSNGIDCFRKLLNWSSNLRINRRDAKLLLGNRLHQIGRNDLAEWLVGPPARRNRADHQTIEYESWDSKNESNPKISEIDKLIYGPANSPAGNFQQQPIANIPDLRRFNNGNHGLDSFKDRSMAMAAPQTRRSVTLTPEGSSAELPGHHHEERANLSGTSPAQDVNGTRDEKPAGSGGGDKEGKGDKQKSPKTLPHLSDDKVPPCLRVPLSTALVVIGTIMTLTCCCALLLRNRLAACFERFRGKKSKTNKRLSADEEQGFMGPRTFGKVPKRSGRKGGGPIDVAHVGIQNSNNGSNGSVRESDEPPTGCCNCCARKKKKNKRKRSKK